VIDVNEYYEPHSGKATYFVSTRGTFLGFRCILPPIYIFRSRFLICHNEGIVYTCPMWEQRADFTALKHHIVNSYAKLKPTHLSQNFVCRSFSRESSQNAIESLDAKEFITVNSISIGTYSLSLFPNGSSSNMKSRIAQLINSTTFNPYYTSLDS
jgi:hypothetical protein